MTIMILVKLAWRNLWRNSKRSWITISAVSTALIFLMAMAGLITGLSTQMLNNGTGLYLGHLQIHNSDYLPDRNMYDWIGEEGLDLSNLLRKISNFPEVKAVSPRVHGFGLISTGEHTVGVQIAGIDPVSESNVTQLMDNLIEGESLSSVPAKQLIIGRTLSRTLQAGLGTVVAVVTQAADGTIGNDLYTVAGIFDSGVAHLNRSLALSHYQDIQELLVLEPWQVHEIVVKTDNPLKAEKISESLTNSQVLPGKSEAKSWGELLPQLKEYLQLAEGMGWILVSLVGIFAAFGTLNTMMMAVFERTREIGTLSSLGMSPIKILAVLLIESVFLAIVGLSIGFTGGMGFLYYLNRQGLDLTHWMSEISMVGSRMDPILKAEWAWGEFGASAVGLVIAVVAATIFPAYRAARMSPVEALRAPTEG
jgi:ABC-type lipoprotein release transport system permease subunit